MITQPTITPLELVFMAGFAVCMLVMFALSCSLFFKRDRASGSEQPRKRVRQERVTIEKVPARLSKREWLRRRNGGR